MTRAIPIPLAAALAGGLALQAMFPAQAEESQGAQRPPSVSALVTNRSAPGFEEVYRAVRDNLTGINETELNRMAVQGLLTELRGKVSLVGAETASSNRPPIARTSALDDGIAYLRVALVAGGLPTSLREAWSALTSTNQVKGLVLDLRFATGDDYAAAAETADLFVAKERTLLDWGGGPATAKTKSDAIKVPVAVLVNRETGGSAEALAAVMREAGAALILGGTTRGSAMVAKEYQLQSGQQLRIASLPVKLGDGTVLSAQGIKPDIEVNTNAEAERAFLDDPYGAGVGKNETVGAAGSSGNTNRLSRRTRPNEADLVRARRDGLSLDEDFPPDRNAEPEKPVIRDPALARAVDLLKGLAVVRRTNS